MVVGLVWGSWVVGWSLWLLSFEVCLGLAGGLA